MFWHILCMDCKAVLPFANPGDTEQICPMCGKHHHPAKTAEQLGWKNLNKQTSSSKPPEPSYGNKEVNYIPVGRKQNLPIGHLRQDLRPKKLVHRWPMFIFLSSVGGVAGVVAIAPFLFPRTAIQLDIAPFAVIAITSLISIAIAMYQLPIILEPISWNKLLITRKNFINKLRTLNYFDIYNIYNTRSPEIPRKPDGSQWVSTGELLLMATLALEKYPPVYDESTLRKLMSNAVSFHINEQQDMTHLDDSSIKAVVRFGRILSNIRLSKGLTVFDIMRNDMTEAEHNYNQCLSRVRELLFRDIDSPSADAELKRAESHRDSIRFNHRIINEVLNFQSKYNITL